MATRKPAASKTAPSKPAPGKPGKTGSTKPLKADASAIKLTRPRIAPKLGPVKLAPVKAANAKTVTRTPVKPGARGRGRAAVPVRTAPTRLVRIKALDPCARCGPGTSVEQLYRVEEQVAGTATVHLVFFDRHGWYCVHGASCVAVRDVHAELKAQRAGFGRRR